MPEESTNNYLVLDFSHPYALKLSLGLLYDAAESYLQPENLSQFHQFLHQIFIVNFKFYQDLSQVLISHDDYSKSNFVIFGSVRKTLVKYSKKLSNFDHELLHYISH